MKNLPPSFPSPHYLLSSFLIILFISNFNSLVAQEKRPEAWQLGKFYNEKKGVNKKKDSYLFHNKVNNEYNKYKRDYEGGMIAIIHMNDSMYHMENLVINLFSDKKRYTFYLKNLPKSYVDAYYEMKLGQKLYISESINTLSQMHLFMSPSAIVIDTTLGSINTVSTHDLDSFHMFYTNKYRISKDGNTIFNQEATTKKPPILNSNWLKGCGLMAGGCIGGGAFVAYGGLEVICGCPHVYISNGDQLNFNNTMFTGAISSKLERNDYKLLPDLNSDSTNYSFTIKNEENEIQYINLSELMVVNHSNKQTVLPDQAGIFYSISNPVQAEKVVNGDGKNIQELVMKIDGIPYPFDGDLDPNFDKVTATFAQPVLMKNRKLIINAKNSKWSSYIHQSLKTILGDKAGDMRKKNAKKSREELEKDFAKHGITLQVEIKNGDKWVNLENINLIGDVNYNELVVPLPNGVGIDKTIEIRLISGFKFWELDYIALDTSKPQELNIQTITPTLINEKNKELSIDDDQYVKLKKGDSLIISYHNLQINKELKRTIILHSKGYYVSTDEGKGKANKIALIKLNQKGGLSKFSKKLNTKVLEHLATYHNTKSVDK